MDDDFNEQFDEIFGGEGDTPELTPTWRATIRRGRLMLTGWAPWLITGGPMGNLLPERARSGVTIADLTIHCEDQDEVSVHYLVRTDRDYDPEEILADWAQQVGHRRIWFPDRMVELPPDPDQITGVTVRCDNCRARWSDGTPEFWLGVRRGEGVSEVVPDVRVRDASVDRPPGSPARRMPGRTRGRTGRSQIRGAVNDRRRHDQFRPPIPEPSNAIAELLAEPLRVGEPDVTGPLAVFPIFGPAPRAEYLPFAAARAQGFRIGELQAGASVNDLLVENPTDSNVLLYEGEEVLGAQQNRTFDMSVLVGAGSKLHVPVSCVEAGRWDGARHAEDFEAAPQTAYPELRRQKATTGARASRSRGSRPAPTRAPSGTRSPPSRRGWASTRPPARCTTSTRVVATASPRCATRSSSTTTRSGRSSRSEARCR